jgi:hypothetical protein
MIPIYYKDLVQGKRYYILRDDKIWGVNGNKKWSGIFDKHYSYYDDMSVTSVFKKIICYCPNSNIIYWEDSANLKLTEPLYLNDLEYLKPYTFIYYKYSKDEFIEKSIQRQKKML